MPKSPSKPNSTAMPWPIEAATLVALVYWSRWANIARSTRPPSIGENTNGIRAGKSPMREQRDAAQRELRDHETYGICSAQVYAGGRLVKGRDRCPPVPGGSGGGKHDPNALDSRGLALAALHVRFIPSGVISSAHARTSAIGEADEDQEGRVPEHRGRQVLPLPKQLRHLEKYEPRRTVHGGEAEHVPPLQVGEKVLVPGGCFRHRTMIRRDPVCSKARRRLPISFLDRGQ